MMIPTSEQIKRLWEECGLFFIKDDIMRPGYYRYKTEYMGNEMSIDLNNLFEYAVPKLIAYLATQPIGCPSILLIYRWIFDRWLEEMEDESDFTLALFWVCYKAFGLDE